MTEADIHAAPAPEAPAAGETRAFQADVSRLLDLMVHSIYSERDVFLRELISNAADACEKLRYEAISAPELTADGEGFAVRVLLDKEAGTLGVSDNGIGMTREDLDRSLGTIASSGTKAFLDRIGPDAEGESGNLIGQFGIGFYSAFMVADSVEVRTRRAGSNEAWRWTSDGKGAYAVAALPLDEAPARGTRVTLHLNPDAAKEYLEPWRVERLVKEHSGAVAVPIDFVEKPGEEPRRLTDGAALWAKNKSEVTPEQYAEFYRNVAGQYDEPALTIHYRAEGRHEYSVLAFVPGSKPFDLFDPQRKGRTKLYVRRVLITDEADLLPGWLRFVRAVVDTADLPLNVSRETVQNSPLFAAIRKGVTGRVLGDLGKMAENDPEAFAKVWDDFGPVLKEGLYEDPERRDGLFKLARFATTKHPEGGRTLAQYAADLRENQTAIFYLVGDDLARLKASPQLEGFRARGIEVLLLPDAVDAFWVQNAVGFDGKPFKSVTQGAADIKAVPLAEGGAATDAAEVGPKVATLLAFMKQTLEGSVEDVRASDRLSESPACLVAPEFGPDRRLEKILAQHGRLGAAATKPVLEVNPGHPLVAALADRFAGDGDRAVVEDAAWLLHDEARIMDGELPADAAAFAARLRRVMERAAG